MDELKATQNQLKTNEEEIKANQDEMKSTVNQLKANQDEMKASQDRIKVRFCGSFEECLTASVWEIVKDFFFTLNFVSSDSEPLGS